MADEQHQLQEQQPEQQPEQRQQQETSTTTTTTTRRVKTEMVVVSPVIDAIERFAHRQRTKKAEKMTAPADQVGVTRVISVKKTPWWKLGR